MEVSLPDQRTSRVCRALLVFALLGAGGTVARAESVPLPPELDGRLLLEVRGCEARLGRALMAATVRARTGPTAVEVPNLRCGAFVPGSDQALFLNAVDGLDRIPAHTTRQVTTFFPADARHSECRCVVGAVRRIERESDDAPFAGSDREPWEATGDAWPSGRLGPFGVAAEERDAAPAGSGASSTSPPPSSGVLRRESILVPGTPLRDRADGAGNVLALLQAGDPVDVLSLAGGIKRVRTLDGREGWIPSGASSVGSARAALLALALSPARDPSASGDDAKLCSEVRREDLADLVFALLPESRAAYVRPLWYALAPADHDAFGHWAYTCFGVTRIIDVARGLEVRNFRWGDAPASRR